MRPNDFRALGSTGLALTQMGFGGAPLGSMRTVVSEDGAAATLTAAWDAGFRYYDTAPWYGRGLSERRVGTFLKDQQRDQFVISTKVGRVLRPAVDRAFDPAPWAGGLPFEVVFDYSYDGIMRSFEDSLQRLGMASVDLLLIHDLDAGYHGQELDAFWAQLETSGWRALTSLKDSQVISGIGAGINGLGLVPRFLEHFAIDFFLLASPYTLLDQRALEIELPLCVDRGVGVVIGAVFNSGILATGITDHAQYNYADADPVVLDRVRHLLSVCERHKTSLRAAALQFPLGHPAVAAVIQGAFQPEQVVQNVEDFQQVIPEAFWEDLKAEKLLAENAPVPEAAVNR